MCIGIAFLPMPTQHGFANLDIGKHCTGNYKFSVFITLYIIVVDVDVSLSLNFEQLTSLDFKQ